MRARLEQIMDRYGQTVTLFPRRGGEALETRAFLQPLLKGRDEPPVAVTPLGPVSSQRWLCIGRAGVEVLPGDRMTYGELELTVQEVQTVSWRSEALYRRSILRRTKEEAL